MDVLRDPAQLVQLAIMGVALGIILFVTLERTLVDPRFPMATLLLSQGVVPAATGGFSAAGVLAAMAVVWGGRLSVLLLIMTAGVGGLTLWRHHPEERRAGAALMLGGVAFAGTGLLSEFATAEIGQRSHIGLLSYLAAWVAFSKPAWLVLNLKRVLGIYVVGSAAAVMLLPYATIEYSGSIIGLGSRAAGLLPHPNGLAPIMLLYLVLEALQPSARWIRWPVGGTAAVLLVLSQSKTTWGAAVIAAILLWVGRSPRRDTARLVAVALAVVTLGATLVMTDDAGEYDIVDRQQVDSLGTLTGRTAVWAYGLERWSEDPVFGAGSRVFREFASRTGQEWAGQAHNQYIQTLGRHGLLGLAGLLLYLGVLTRVALRHRRRTRYVSMALFAQVLVRTMAESNLDSFGVEQLVVFTLFVAWEREMATDEGPPSPDAVSVADARPEI